MLCLLVKIRKMHSVIRMLNDKEIHFQRILETSQKIQL